jgi:ribosomal protein L11 methylase PrmA
VRSNRIENQISDQQVSFYHAGLEEGFNLTGTADVILANIISDVLCIYADDLIKSVNPGGVLVLSGILNKEQDAVLNFFSQKCEGSWGKIKVDGRTMGEWSDVALFRIR